MRRLLLTEDATGDLWAIHTFVGADSPRAANTLLTRIHDAMQRLVRSPGIGHLRSDIADEDVRVHPVQRYLIIYRQHGDDIEVLRVLHGARDIERLLGADDQVD